jgi:hypothetical protein
MAGIGGHIAGFNKSEATGQGEFTKSKTGW